MGKRRLLLATILFVLSGAVLVVMNRYSSFFTQDTTPKPGAAVAPPRNFSVQFYDPQTGQPSGRLVAESYETLPDGRADCRDVAMSLAGTSFGDVALSCKRAVVRVNEVSRNPSGEVALEGGVSVSAVKDGEVTASGRFDKVTFDSKTDDLAAEGAVEMAWGRGLSLAGTDLVGNTRSMIFTVKRDITVRIRPGDVAEDDEAAASGMPEELVVTAGGPLTYESPSPDKPGSAPRIIFGGGVAAEGGDLALEGSDLVVEFEGGEAAAPGEMPRGWKPRSLKIAGPALVRRGDVLVKGSRIDWNGAGGLAVVEGSPSRVERGADFVEAPSIKAVVSGKGEMISVEAVGAGRAVIAAEAMNVETALAQAGGNASRPTAESSASEVAAGSEPAHASEAVPVVARWRDSLRYEEASRTLAMDGAVDVAQGPMRLEASKVIVVLEPLPSNRIASFDAAGPVLFADSRATVKADSASYRRASDMLALDGAPVTVEAERALFSAREISYAQAAGKLSAHHDCRLEMQPRDDAAPEAEESGSLLAVDRGAPLVVTAPRITADISGETADAVCEGGVTVEAGESRLACTRLRVSGIPNDAVRPGGEPSAAGTGALVEGTGKVAFERGAFKASGARFTFEEAGRKLNLFAGDGASVKMTFGETATVWAQSVAADLAADTIECEKPDVAITAKGMLLGFPTETSTKSSSGSGDPDTVTSLYIKADRMAAQRLGSEKGTITFDGAVEGAARNPDAAVEDRITAGALILDVAYARPAAASNAGAPADMADMNATLTGALASGGVTLRYAGPDQVLEARGDSFEWQKAANHGRLAGSPALVWTDDATFKAEAREVHYDFAEESVSVVGAKKFVMKRKKTARD